VALPLCAQQPQTQTAPVFATNAKYVQGVGPGYWATKGSGLTLNLSAGTAQCSVGVFDNYAGGTLSLTDNATNYVFLDTTSSCAPAFNTSGFPSTGIPVAKAVTASGAITTITDYRGAPTLAASGAGVGLPTYSCSSHQFVNSTTAPSAIACAQPADSDLATSDITTNDVSTSKHGFAPKVPNDATKYLDGTGAYSVPPGTSGAGFKGVLYKTSNYTLASGDKGYMVICDGGSDFTVAAPPGSVGGDWWAGIQNVGDGLVTLSSGGISGGFDGVTASITLRRHEGLLFFDNNGTALYTERGQKAAVYGAESGSANAYTVTVELNPGAYSAGLTVIFKATNANTTASTLDLNALGAKAIKKLDGATALTSGDIAAGQIVVVVYDGTNFQMLSPAAQSLVAGGDLSGTLPAATVAKVNGNTPGGTCTNQVVTALDSSARPTCATVTAAYTSGLGTVTSIATTSPITGGTITDTGTVACATCVVSSSAPAAGYGHFAGSTQTETSTTIPRGIPFTIGDPAGSTLTVASTTTDYVTVPFACTISAYNLVIDAGTITVKFWKVATGTAIPTSSNSISTSGVGISTGTAIHSTTTSDFTTTTVTANDILAMNVTAVATAKYVQGVLQCDQSQ
jgi:hypothetical protein